MANQLRIHLMNAAARPLGSALAQPGGSMAYGDYAFALGTCYNKGGDESKLLNWGVMNWNYAVSGAADYYLYATWPSVNLSAPNHQVRLSWNPPLRNGLAVPDVDHFAIFYQRTTGIYDILKPGSKVAVQGYADGRIPPSASSAVVLTDTPLVTSTDTPVTNFDTARNAFWIDGDHRVSFSGFLTFETRVTISGTTSNDGVKTVKWCDLAFSNRGVQTIIAVYEPVVSEVPNAGKLLTYEQGPATFTQIGMASWPNYYHTWGALEYIQLSPVDQMDADPREQCYKGFDGMISPVDFGIDLLDDALAITIPKVGCSAWEWAYMRHWQRSCAQLWMVDLCDVVEGTALGGDRAGYGATAQWFGRMRGMRYLGNRGKNKQQKFGLTFYVESEV